MIVIVLKRFYIVVEFMLLIALDTFSVLTALSIQPMLLGANIRLWNMAATLATLCLDL